jgi:hypothetical protein
VHGRDQTPAYAQTKTFSKSKPFTMRKIRLLNAGLLALFIFLLQTSKAQVDTSTTKKLLQYIFDPVDKSQVNSGFLEEYGCPIIPMSTFNGNLSDSNNIDINLWRILFFQTQTSWVGTGSNPLPAITTVNNSLATAIGDTIPIPILISNYDVLKTNAITSNLLSYNSLTRKLYDVPGRPSSPYEGKRLFAASPVINQSLQGHTTFKIDNNTVWNTTGLSISQLQIDFDDDEGFQTISLGTAVDVSYTDTGMKRWTIKATLSDSSVWQCYSEYYVARPASASRYGDFSPTLPSWGIISPVGGVHSGGRAYVHYSSKSRTNTLRKPLIIVEGYDVSFRVPGLQSNYSVYDFVASLDDANSTGWDFNEELDEIAGYDLVFIDFNDGADNIVRNAAVVQAVINAVNANKVNDDRFSNVRQENVVMGLSMGGLCARYALANMTKNFSGTPTETRLLITHDSPHRGANVPLGIQYLVRMMGNIELFDYDVYDILPQYDDIISLFDAPATSEMLIYRSTGTTSYSANTFLDATYRPMISFSSSDPQPSYRFIATSQGNECGNALFSPGQAFIDMGAGVSAGAKIKLFGFKIPILSYKLALEVEARALPNAGQTSKIARVYAINNLKILGVINVFKQLYNQTAYAPGTHLPIDGAPGSTNPLTDVVEMNQFQSWPQFSINFALQFTIAKIVTVYFDAYAYNNGMKSTFTFIPAASALDVSPFTSASLSQNYVNGTNQAFPSSSATFIAQETVTGNPSVSNNIHLKFTTRNSKWIYKEMEELNNLENCSSECSNSYFIKGPDYICSGTNGLFSIPGLPRGASVSWSATPSGIISIASPSAAETSVSFSNNGKVTLIATITNSCFTGSVQIQKTITVGTPSILMAYFANAVGGEGFWCSTHYGNTFTIDPATNDASFEAELRTFPSMSLYAYANPAVPEMAPFSYAPNGWYIFRIRGTNACGTGDWFETEVEYVDCFEYEGGMFRATVMPNPSKGSINVQLSGMTKTKAGNSKPSNNKVIYQLYDLNRSLKVKEWTMDGQQQGHKLSTYGVRPGQYILVATYGEQKTSTKIIIEQ